MLGSNLSAMAMLNGMGWHQEVPALFYGREPHGTLTPHASSMGASL